MYVPQGTASITVLVARDRQLLRLTLPLPQADAPRSNSSSASVTKRP
jgi:hypothetical protein